MRRFILSCMIAASASSLAAQRATELFIPIGQSPDLSGEETVMGTVEALDPAARTIVVRDEQSGDEHEASLTEGTEIYLDRSKLNAKNDYGTFADLRVGARVEMLYEDEPAEAGTLRWIKIEIATER